MTNFCELLRYENSSMPGDKIAELVTETLAAVGLKVCFKYQVITLNRINCGYLSKLQRFGLSDCDQISNLSVLRYCSISILYFFFGGERGGGGIFCSFSHKNVQPNEFSLDMFPLAYIYIFPRFNRRILFSHLVLVCFPLYLESGNLMYLKYS